MNSTPVVFRRATALVLFCSMGTYALAGLEPASDTFRLSSELVADPAVRTQRDEFEIAPYTPKTSYWLSYSKRGTTAGGAIGWRDYRVKGFGFELGFSDTSEVEPNSVSGSFPPIGVIPAGIFNKGPLLGADVLYFFGPRDAELFVGLGLYSQSEVAVGRVPGLNLLYNLGETQRGFVAVSFGTRIWVHKRFGIGASYHSERGRTLTLAIRS